MEIGQQRSGRKRAIENSSGMRAGRPGESRAEREGASESSIAIPQIGDRDFKNFIELIYRECGIALSDAKRAMLIARLSKRMREIGESSFASYYRLVVESPAERIVMLDFISTNETHFFREPQQFDYLENQVFPEWKERMSTGSMEKSISVWSAGCSTGEEPYSIAMALLAYFPPGSGVRLSIVATDLSTRVLAKAEQALWRIDKAEEVPERYLKQFMLKGIAANSGSMKAGVEIRGLIRFMRLNLKDAPYPVTGKFDLVFCRNVLIYFDTETKRQVVCRLLDYVRSRGYLLLGHAESLNGLTDRGRSVFPTIYTPNQEPAALESRIVSGRTGAAKELAR